MGGEGDCLAPDKPNRGKKASTPPPTPPPTQPPPSPSFPLPLKGVHSTYTIEIKWPRCRPLSHPKHLSDVSSARHDVTRGHDVTCTARRWAGGGVR